MCELRSWATMNLWVGVGILGMRSREGKKEEKKEGEQGSARLVSPRGVRLATRIRIPQVTSLIECGMNRLEFKS